jgi:hypothetical protein
MKYIEYLQNLDDLIGKNTKPPATAMLRNQLHFALEQAEAESAQAENKDKLCKEQAATIAKLEGRIRKLETVLKLNRPNSRVPPQAPNIF